MKGKAKSSTAGFTLLEMMIVISLIIILLSIAMPIYSQSIRRVNEDNLRKNVVTLNQMIAQYTLDKKTRPPLSRRFAFGGIYRFCPR